MIKNKQKTKKIQKMRKLILILVLLIVVSISSKGQFKNFALLENYSLLVSELEPFKPVPSSAEFYLEWMDTTVSVHREIANYLQLDFPLDTALLANERNKNITKEEIDLIMRIKMVKSFPNLEQISSSGKKRKKTRRSAYEMQRLDLIISSFAKAKADSNFVFMSKNLELMVFYYQNRSLLSTKKAFKNYEKQFLSMRKEYADMLAACFEAGECSKGQISNLFSISLNAWPDLSLAQAVLQRWYNQEWLYLFRGVDINRLEKVTFTSASECFLSLLYLYNIAGKEGAYELVGAFERLFKLQFSSWKKEAFAKNLRRYLNIKQKVFPQ